MTARSGLGPVELAVLSAYVELGASETSGRVKNRRVVLAAAAISGVAPRYVWDVLRDVARPYRVAVPLVDFQGNLEAMGWDPLVEASYSERPLSGVPAWMSKSAVAAAAAEGSIPASDGDSLGIPGPSRSMLPGTSQGAHRIREAGRAPPR